jgi:hypothetical protein
MGDPVSGHTPGPWGYFRADISFDDEAWVVDLPRDREYDTESQDDEAVRLYQEVARVNDGEDYEGEAEANARLIASAPTLLAALEAFATVRAHPFGDPYLEDLEAFARGAESAIRAAIGDGAFEAKYPGGELVCNAVEKEGGRAKDRDPTSSGSEALSGFEALLFAAGRMLNAHDRFGNSDYQARYTNAINELEAAVKKVLGGK